MRAGRDADAIREFRAAIPALIAAPREDAQDEDTTLISARRERLQNIVEAYLSLLAKTRSEAGGNIADETFGLADAVRGKSVQRALAESSARMAARDPSLAALIRSEQDLTMQVNALFGTLSNVLALAPAERDEEGVKAINATIAKMRADRDEARNEIARRFPSYRDFIDPKPLTADALRASLRQGEALLSFYFGQYASFAWVVPKGGPTAFAAIPTTADAMERKVRGLRRTLEAEVERVADLPVYDLALAYELYGLPLKPLQASWMPARHLIVVTNGALGLLLLSLLPTAPAPLEQDQGIAVCRLPKRAVAGAHPRCDERTLGLGAVGIAATAARFRQARAADRLRRPLLQPRASAARGGRTHRGSGRGRRGARRAPSRRTRRRERRQRRACAAAAPAGHRR